jgi:Uma2 family endonuclease
MSVAPVLPTPVPAPLPPKPKRNRARGGQQVRIEDISWSMYTKLLKAFGKKRIRLTYDRGTLEIMTITHKHAKRGYFLGRMVDELTMELEIPMKAGANTTFRRKRKAKGLEPDNSYWIASELLVRGKDEIDLEVDPPPDLSLEIDVTHSSMNRMGIYAALKVPEVWRYDDQSLVFFVLNERGEYLSTPTSKQFPFLRPADLLPFLAKLTTMDENAIIREFRAWIQANKPQP